MRQISGDSPVHRLWAGTKLLAVMVLGTTLSYFPWWPAGALMAAFLLVVARLARIPSGALPRLPGWVWALLGLGAALALLAGGAPVVVVAGAHVGLGSVEQLARLTVIGGLIFVASLLVGWTTSQADIGPAIARLGSPLRRLRVPVDEWAVVVALCVRCLPLLLDEMRTLMAVRRLRPRPSAGAGTQSRRHRAQRWLAQPVDLLVAALAVSMRRAGEMAEAITSRGGTGSITAGTAAPGPADAVALVLVTTVCVVAALLPNAR
ncbi:MAG: energy-coupling factor transporter transmembrane component T family protein [Acidimicrobiales bacterium]